MMVVRSRTLGAGRRNSMEPYLIHGKRVVWRREKRLRELRAMDWRVRCKAEDEKGEDT